MSSAPTPTSDGRIARGLRTRESVIGAFEELIREGTTPTGAELARRAGVSCRSIFTHFGDMDGVTAEAARRALSRLLSALQPFDQTLSLEDRISAFAQRRGEQLEALSPILRVLTARRPPPPALAELIAASISTTRSYIEAVFEVELATTPEPTRERLRESLVAIGSWPHWQGLREAQSLDVETAKSVLAFELCGLFARRS